jgi:hypothetical protein
VTILAMNENMFLIKISENDFEMGGVVKTLINLICRLLL